MVSQKLNKIKWNLLYKCIMSHITFYQVLYRPLFYRFHILFLRSMQLRCIYNEYLQHEVLYFRIESLYY